MGKSWRVLIIVLVIALLTRNEAPIQAQSAAIIGLTLVNADSNAPISALTNGMIIRLSDVGWNLNVSAQTEPTPLSWVRFEYDGNGEYSYDDVPPYSLEGDVKGDYFPWTPTSGVHSLTAIPYLDGVAGTSLTVTFTVEEEICSGVTEIPLSECRALVDFYRSTGGDNWIVKTGWLQTKTPCSWYNVGCSGGHVTSLSGWGSNDWGNGLTGTLPESLRDLPYLEVLDLVRNNLSGPLPWALWQLTNLRDLALAWNSLNGSIPEEIGNLRQLSGLNLGTNQFSGLIPESIGNLTRLSYLELGGNQLEGSIPYSFARLTALTQLSLSSNNLHGDFSIVTQLPLLLELLLDQNACLYGSTPDARARADALKPAWWPHVWREQRCGDLTPSLTSFALINADSDTIIRPLTTGSVINLRQDGSNLSVVAHRDLSKGHIDWVIFGYDGNSEYSYDPTEPFALEGDVSGDYYPWTPTRGPHLLQAIPFARVVFNTPLSTTEGLIMGDPIAVSFDSVRR